MTDSLAAGRQRVIGFADVVRIPMRRWRLVLAVTGAVLLATLAYLLFFPATYTATTVVVLRPVVTDPFTYPSSGADRVINMTAETGVATGNQVIDTTARALGRDADDVRDALSVEVPSGGQVLRFMYADSTAVSAVTGANAAAETYLRVRESDYQQQRESLLRSYDSTMQQVTDQRKTAQKGLPGSGAGSSSTTPRTQAMLDQVSALNDQIAELANQRAKIASADLTPGVVTAAAREPVPSSHDAALLFIAGALLGGALLGTITAHAREAMDRRVRSTEQAADLTAAPALGVVRSARQNHGDTAASDARYVSLAVLRWAQRHPGRPLVVLSERDDEGRTMVSGNLAAALAEAGQHVRLAALPDRHDELRRILFAAQTRTPPRHGPAQGPGSRPKPWPATEAATETRINGSSHGSTVHRGTVASAGGASGTYGEARLRVGPDSDPDATVVMEAPPRQPPVLSPPEPEPPRRPGDGAVPIGDGEVLLCDLDETSGDGTVLVDAPPSATDARGVRAALSGEVLLVVARDRTRHRDLTRLIERLRSAGVRTAGFVLTGGRHA
ncbi:hypothetical protein [Mangrovihabitans endophyticus]|uniref:hypothetical protein n=1 Tax=Mangrovihabitans endophyticus TaxID=1751298 RepID=UPI0016690A12|nr:hypothetical protein [Mangrovihabitans endophyticus]